jgi:hypothetical protein
MISDEGKENWRNLQALRSFNVDISFYYWGWVRKTMNYILQNIKYSDCSHVGIVGRNLTGAWAWAWAWAWACVSCDCWLLSASGRSLVQSPAGCVYQ